MAQTSANLPYRKIMFYTLAIFGVPVVVLSLALWARGDLSKKADSKPDSDLPDQPPGLDPALTAEVKLRLAASLAAGKPQETVFYPEFQPGRGIALSAATWLNTFGPPPGCNASTVKFLPEVTIPVLVLHGEKDEISVPESARAVFDAASAAPRRDLLWADAGHFFFTPEEAMRYSRPLADWLRSVAPP